jgi:hypothetical protein
MISSLLDALSLVNKRFAFDVSSGISSWHQPPRRMIMWRAFRAWRQG